MIFCNTAKEIQDYIAPIIKEKKDCKLKKIFSNEYHELKEGGIWEVEDAVFLLFEDGSCMEIRDFINGQVCIDDDVFLPDDEAECFDFFNTTQGRYSSINACKEETITFQMDYGKIGAIRGTETKGGVLYSLTIETEGGEIWLYPRCGLMELWSSNVKKEIVEEEPLYGLTISDLELDEHICFFINPGELPPFELDSTMSFVTDLYDYKYRLFLSKEEFEEFSEQIKDLQLEITDQMDFTFWAMIMADIKKHGFAGYEYSEQGELKLNIQRLGDQFKVRFCDETRTPPMNIEFLSDLDCMDQY